VCQPCPDYRLFAEDLQVTSVMANREGNGVKNRTFESFWCSSWLYFRKRLMQTFAPSRVPRYTSPNPPDTNGSESALRRQDERETVVGSIASLPHTPLSSEKHFWEAGLERSRRSQAYANLSGEQERGHGNVRHSDSQQATPDHRLGGSVHIGRSPARRVCC